MSRDRREHVPEFDSQPLPFHYKFLNLMPQQLGALFPAGFGKDGNDRADAGTGLEQAVIHQVGNNLVCRVWIDLEFFA